MRVLCVAEKNSIAKEVARILGGGRTRTRDTGCRYVKNYDFSCQLAGQQCTVTMTAVLGHITTVDFDAAHAWGKCPPGRLFEAPLVTRLAEDSEQRSRKIRDNIRKEARAADQLMIWTDCDREGEYIAWEIANAAHEGNARLAVAAAWRAVFSHLEEAHIVQAARAPQRIDMQQVEAVQCRMEFDLRVGVLFTRFLTNTYKAQNLVGVKDVVSYGTCQFPTLSFVVDRYLRVKSFTVEPFWYISMVALQGQKVTFSWARNHLFDKLFVAILYQRLFDAPPPLVSKVEAKPQSKWRPLPLTTVELQKCCARNFRMPAKTALDAAEQLYTAGFISYPRTETDQFPQLMDLRLYVGKQTQDTRWGQYAAALLSDKFSHPRSGRNNDGAHPPIYPVKYANVDSLRGAQKNVYEFIVRHFLACCSHDAKGRQTKVEVAWGSERFHAQGLDVYERNFLDVYPYVKWSSSEQLPTFKEGDQVNVHLCKLKEGKTSPPEYMTEPELIALMDANGIGTDATIAEHIDKIILRNYIVREKKGRLELLIPTTLGVSLIQGFDAVLADRISLSKPFLRRALEAYLKRIVSGEIDKGHVVAQLLPHYKEAFLESNRKANVIVETFRETTRRVSQQA